nr:hypothetical protein [Bacteroidota bacterium]
MKSGSPPFPKIYFSINDDIISRDGIPAVGFSSLINPVRVFAKGIPSGKP